jgi:predicted hydrocarbon binding protein
MLKDVKETATWERHNGGFSVIDVPAVIISIETFVSFQKNAERILGCDGAAVLLYETGKKAGEQWVSRFSKEWGLRDKEFIEAVQNFYAELGWGMFDIKENSKKELIIRVENSFIVRGYGKSTAAVCHFLRGYNAGLAEVLKEKYLEACETRCMAKGDDCCEFVMKRMD